MSRDSCSPYVSIGVRPAWPFHVQELLSRIQTLLFCVHLARSPWSSMSRLCLPINLHSQRWSNISSSSSASQVCTKTPAVSFTSSLSKCCRRHMSLLSDGCTTTSLVNRMAVLRTLLRRFYLRLISIDNISVGQT